jgi:hypothetical protein
MVNLSDRLPRRLKVCARFIRQRGFGRSIQRSAARLRLLRAFSFAALNFRSQRSAFLRNATASETPATLQNSLSCSVIKVHKDFGFWILDFGLSVTGLKLFKPCGHSNPKSKI